MTLATSQIAVAQDQTSPEDTINALNGVFGRHQGERSSHAKGHCASGRFIPTFDGRAFSNTQAFAGEVAVTARFSIGGGNPMASDKSRSVRGLGVRFHLANDEELDLVVISAPVFFAATPAQFVNFLKARMADPKTGQKDPARITAFNEANPNVLPHLTAVSQTPPPASYATAPYFSTHAFLFDESTGAPNAARWVLQPVAGFVGLTKDQEETFPDTFLEHELKGRLAAGPAEWDILLQVAADGDSLVDPSAPWPDTRRMVNVGRLVINEMLTGSADETCTDFVFDPNNLPTGIAATDDPILAIRSPAYAVSHSRRQE